MSLERTTSLGSLLLSSTLLALAGCGDDSTGTGTSESATGGSTDATTAPMTTMDSVDTTAAPETTTTGDPTTGVDTTAGEESSSDSSSTTGVPGDCAGSGMSFSTLTSVDNDLVTNLDVMGVVSCNRDITLTATGGTVCVLDDGADGYYYVVETIALADVPPVMCGLAQVGLTNLSIDNFGEDTDVVVPQAGGAMVGNQPIVVVGDVEGSSPLGPIGPAPLADFTGVLPEGEAAFGAGDTTVSYADNVTVVATAAVEFAGLPVTVTLTGLTGSLTYAM